MNASLVSPTPGESCEVLVVGGGLAGCELAVQLERHGARDTMVLEAGPAEELVHTNFAHDPDDALRHWLEPGTDPYFRRPWSSRYPPHYTGTSGIRQRLGGRSLYWYGVALPIEEWALREPWWPAPVIADLTEGWHGGRPLYEQVTAELAAWVGHADALAAAPTDVTLAGSRLVRAPRAIRRAADAPARWYAYSPLDHWRDPETGRTTAAPAGVTIHPGVEVVAVCVEGGRARGVLARRAGVPGTLRIDANKVVLAAGALVGSRLAMQALHDAGALSAPRLAGLCDHMVQGAFLRLSDAAAQQLVDILPPGTYYAPCPDAVRSNLFLDVALLPGGAVLLDLQLTGEQLSSLNSYVECDARAPRPWPLTVHSRPGPADREVLDGQRVVLSDALAELLALVGHAVPALEFGDFDAPLRTNDVVLAQRAVTTAGAAVTWSGFLGTEDHEGGTLALGRILANDLQFTGVDRLYAVGPATFPRLGAANVALTALALSHRLARTLAGDTALDRAHPPRSEWAASR